MAANPFFLIQQQPSATELSAEERCTAAICTSLKRLSHQLRVDFAMDVHGSGDKRRREPTRSIYEEAALKFEKEEGKRQMAKKRKAKMSAARNQKKAAGKRKAAKVSNQTTAKKGKKLFPSKKFAETEEEEEVSAGISEVEEDDRYHSNQAEPEHNETLLMHAAAASLAQLGARPGIGATTENGKIASIEQAMVEAMNKAHTEVLAAKDEAIKATSAALAAKDELVRAQAAMIAMMMQGTNVRNGA
jgi:hypothetical protein